MIHRLKPQKYLHNCHILVYVFLQLFEIFYFGIYLYIGKIKIIEPWNVAQ